MVRRTREAPLVANPEDYRRLAATAREGAIGAYAAKADDQRPNPIGGVNKEAGALKAELEKAKAATEAARVAAGEARLPYIAKDLTSGGTPSSSTPWAARGPPGSPAALGGTDAAISPAPAGMRVSRRSTSAGAASPGEGRGAREQDRRRGGCDAQFRRRHERSGNAASRHCLGGGILPG